MRLQLGDPTRNFLYANVAPAPSQADAPNLLTGLPAVGFWASNFLGMGNPGVPANFAVFAPHGGERGLDSATVTVASDGRVSWQRVQP